MNYFIKANEDLIQSLNYEVDKFTSLHEDMVKFWNRRIKENDFNEWAIQEIKYNEYISGLVSEENIKLTCDYIGPSTYIAKNKRGLSLAEVLEYYISSREFGGHMIWPSKEIGIKSDSTIKKSINTARSYCFKERIDYALFGIKKWYEKSEISVEVFSNVLNGNKNWLKQFRDFNGFIKFFMLNAFVNNEYNVYNLSSYINGEYTTVISDFPIVKFTTKQEYPDNLIEAYIPNKYSDYISGCIVAIKTRSKDIDIFMCKR